MRRLEEGKDLVLRTEEISKRFRERSGGSIIGEGDFGRLSGGEAASAEEIGDVGSLGIG